MNINLKDCDMKDCSHMSFVNAANVNVKDCIYTGNIAWEAHGSCLIIIVSIKLNLNIKHKCV